MEAKPGYEPLALVLFEALQQAQAGKGHERHGSGKPFLDQPIFNLAEDHGPAFLSGQVAKKASESLGLFAREPDGKKAQAECLGMIVYAAALWLYFENHKTV